MKPLGITFTAKRGFGVAISRDDGSEFLACSHPGLLPAVFADRKWAVAHKRKLIGHNFKCRVVRVAFADVMSLADLTKGLKR